MSLKTPPAKPASRLPLARAAAASKADDRRWAQRKPRSLPAVLLSDKLQSQVQCLVRDLSSTGGRIEIVPGCGGSIRSADELPEHFTLYMVTDEMEVDCEVMRREGAFVGVRFTSMSRLRPRQKPMRRTPRK